MRQQKMGAKRRMILGALAILVILWTGLIFWFASTYYFQSPIKDIKFQCFICKRGVTSRQTVTPMYAQEPTPSPTPLVTLAKHPKYLTEYEIGIQKRSLEYLSKYYSGNELQAFDNVILSESWYESTILNPTSGACGIPQALPCDKMKCPLNESGLECQLEWMRVYIINRYQTPMDAWKFRQEKGWY